MSKLSDKRARIEGTPMYMRLRHAWGGIVADIEAADGTILHTTTDRFRISEVRRDAEEWAISRVKGNGQ